MPMRTLHNTFTKGELNPDLYARADNEIYTKGGRRIRNMIPLWAGAVTLYPGTSYVDVIVDRTNSNTPITDYTQVKGVDFQYDVETNIIYTILFRPDTTSTVAIDIYFDDVLQASVAASMYTAAQIKNLNFCVGQDRVLILHEDVPPQQLKRGATHTSWTLSAYTLSVNPVFDFTVLGGTQYRVPGFTFTPGAATGTTTLTASSAIFTANHVGGLFIGNGGVARINTVASATVANITITDDFLSASAINGTTASLNEVMWTSGGGSPTGDNHGWPARGVFYLNRLALGRSKVLKNVVAFSSAGVFDDFDDSLPDATSAFSASFNGRGNQSLQSIVADDSAIFLTSNKTFAQNPLVESAISASNFYFAPQSQNPASEIPACSLDNQVIHVSANYSSVQSVAYSTADAKYMAFPLSLYSSHLFKTLNSNATWEPKNVQARMYMATQLDGTMLSLNILSSQEIIAWSLRNTTGYFRQVIGEGTQASVIVEREVNSGASFNNTPDFVYLTNGSFTAFDDVTAEFTDVSHDTAFLENQYDYVLFGNVAPFTGMQINLATVASVNLSLTFEYLDSEGNWDHFNPVDTTNGFTGNGTITWGFDDVTNWGSYNIFAPAHVSEGLYWIRVRRNKDVVVTPPIEDSVHINTTNRLYLEKFSFDLYTDATIEAMSDVDGNITGLHHLAGAQVYAINSGATYGPYFVDSTGAVNIKNQFDAVLIGTQYKPELVPMPIFAPTQEGLNTYNEKYIEDLYIDYVDSLYLSAGSVSAQSGLTQVPIIPLGGYTLGTPVPPQTGVYLIHPRGTWEPRQEILVTQSLPGPMTIIGIGAIVEVT